MKTHGLGLRTSLLNYNLRAQRSFDTADVNRLERDREKAGSPESEKVNTGFKSSKIQPLHSNWKSTRPRGKGSGDLFGCGPMVPLYHSGKKKLPSGCEAEPLLPFLGDAACCFLFV